MVKTILKKITENRDLTFDETYNLIIELDKDRLTPAQIGGFLVGFLTKGPSITEVAAIAKAMRDICIGIKPKIKGRLIDTCGTGGGLKHSISPPQMQLLLRQAKYLLQNMVAAPFHLHREVQMYWKHWVLMWICPRKR